MRWIYEYENLLYQVWKKKNKKTQSSWNLDETFIKVKIKLYYLYYKIYKYIYILEIQLQKTRQHMPLRKD